jgi:hypothetical protein
MSITEVELKELTLAQPRRTWVTWMTKEIIRFRSTVQDHRSTMSIRKTQKGIITVEPISIVTQSLYQNIFMVYPHESITNEGVGFFPKRGAPVMDYPWDRGYLAPVVSLCYASTLCLLWSTFLLYRYFIVYSSGFDHRSNASFYNLS